MAVRGRDVPGDSPPVGTVFRCKLRKIFGIQPVREAIRAHGSRLDRIVVEEGDHPTLDALARFARDQGIEVERASRRDLDRVAGGARHQGAMALAPELRLLRLDELNVHPRSLLVALDEVQDPQNFGAVVRCAVGLGADAIVWAEHASAPLSPATFRASAGAIEHASLCRVSSLVAAAHTLADRGITAIALDPNGEQELWSVDLTGPVLLAIGSEGKGLRKSVRAACQVRARLPLLGRVESLNASVAAALALYETARQRKFPSSGS